MTPKGGAVDRDMDRSENSKQVFASLLKEARGKLGLTPGEMAAKLGAGYNQYWMWEQAKSLPRTQADKEHVGQRIEALLAMLPSQETEAAPQRTPVETSPPVEPQPTTLDDHGPVKSETKEQYPLPRPAYDDRTLMEQMQDLGVEVVTKNTGKKQQIRWYNCQKVNSAYLYNRVSVTQGDIRLGKAVYGKLLKTGRFVQVGVVEKEGKMLFVLKPLPERGEGSLSISEKGGSARMGSKALVRWLNGQGIGQGRYAVRKVEGTENTYVCLPEAE